MRMLARAPGLTLAVLMALTALIALTAVVAVSVDDGRGSAESGTRPAQTVTALPEVGRSAPGVYTPLAAPSRILDTRDGLGESKPAPIRGHSSIVVEVNGRGAVPAEGVGSLLATLTVQTPAASGALVAYSGTRPTTASLLFTRGHTAAVTVLVTVVDGRVRLANESAAPVDVTLDAVGFYGAGVVPAEPGLFHPVAPERIVDTRAGVGLGRHLPLGDGEQVAAQLVRGRGALPTNDVGAVAMVVHTVSPTSNGSLSLWSPDTSQPPVAAVHYTAGRNSSTFDIVSLGTAADVELYAANTGSVHVVVDVVGYFGYGAPASAGGYQAATSSIQVLGPQKLGPKASTELSLLGEAAVARSHVRAVVVAVQAFRSGAAGRLTLRPSGTAEPPVPISLDFSTGTAASGVFVVPLPRSGRLTLHNDSGGRTTASVALLGYLPGKDVRAPTVSVGRYVRNLTGNGAHDRAIMAAEGAADGRARGRIVLLAIGAEANDRSGVVLSITRTVIPWRNLVQALDAYLDAYAGHSGGAPVKIVLATSNSGDWTHYTGAQRGTDWARKLVDAVHAPAASGISIAAGVDFEAGFSSTEAQAQQWENAYLAATGRGLVYTGDATDCPIVYSSVVRPCSFGWTQTQIYALAHHDRRITVLPQIYAPDDALKWANIDKIGGGGLVFDGALTEHAADPARSLEADHGWVALVRALAWLSDDAQVPSVVDLERNE